MTPTDLDQLAADIHDLTRTYREPIPMAVMYESARPIGERLGDLQAALTAIPHNDPSRGAVVAEIARLTAQQNQVWEHRPDSDGLLTQLARAGQFPTQRTGRGGWVSGGKPGSRPPSGLSHLDLLALMETAVWTWHDELRDLLDDWDSVPVTTVHGATPDRGAEWDPRPWTEVLPTLVGLLERLGDDPTIAHADEPGRLVWHSKAAEVAREVRSWRARCRVLLGYTARTTTLDRRCPACEQTGHLTVREDASSDVVCRARLPIPDIAEDTTWTVCGEKWSRLSWVSLLVQTEKTSA